MARALLYFQSPKDPDPLTKRLEEGDPARVILEAEKAEAQGLTFLGAWLEGEGVSILPCSCRGKGCPECQYTGYITWKGKAPALHLLIPPDPERAP
ncbi:hypothetical protein HRbin39_00040 [bacterium HR39]|nr:hypothetical protein HRbin39_00040 [bacterium HR39]